MDIIILYKTYIFILTFAQNEDHTMATSNKNLHLTDND